MTTIVSFGDVDIDLLLDVDGYPRRGEETFARTVHTRLGGSAVNTAVWLVRLGFESTVLSQVGDDEFGRRATAALCAAGVDTRWLLVSDLYPTGMNVLVVTPDGERTMIGAPGANRTYPGREGWEDGCAWLHVSAYALLEAPQRTSALAAMGTARRDGIPISVDVPSGVAKVAGPGLAETLTGCAIVSVGREALTWIVPAGPAEFLDLGVGTVAVTAGAGPLSVWRGGESVTVTPPQVESVDTTGAGDSFVAGLIAGSLWGLGLGPTATLAAAIGAGATQERGAGNEESFDLPLLLSSEGWPDVDPVWLEQARRSLDGR